jgi:flagellar hook protein FlgE
MQAFQQAMDVISNNIANVNTTAFKTSRTELSDSFSQQLAQVGQVGLGVQTAKITENFSQGAVTRTGVATDLSVSGDGFFVVQDPISSVQYVTRAGNFHVDESGYLVINTGMRVQGYNDLALSSVGDIQIDAASRPDTADSGATMTGFTIGTDGKITVSLSDGSQYVRGQILMQNFANPRALTKVGQNLYSGIGAAGPLGGATSPTPAEPGTNGMGQIFSGSLELSNVDLSNEFATLITTQRAFQANARVITTSDEMLQELANLKR